jgi:hypothetical protein
MGERAREKGELTDAEIRQRMTSDPEKRKRASKLADQVRKGEAPSGPRLSAEELAHFLRDSD